MFRVDQEFQRFLSRPKLQRIQKFQDFLNSQRALEFL